MNKIDINEKTFYEYGKPHLKERTKKRLAQMVELGMVEICYGQFGIKGSMSGLYIEKVWSYSDEDWKGYINWVKGLIKLKHG